MGEWLKHLSAVDKVFFSSAVLGAAMFLFRTVFMIIGHDTDAQVDGAGADFDAHVDVGGDADVGHFEVDHGDVGGGDADVGAGDADVGHVEVDHGDTDHADSDAGLRMLSYQGLMGFFLMFGLVGLALSRGSTAAAGWAFAGAVMGGLIMMWVLAKLLASMKRLHSDGTLNLYNAIGQEGSVYLRIPAGGTGKVQITVQERLMFFDAMADSGEEILTGEHIRVRRVVSGNIMVVEKCKPLL